MPDLTVPGSKLANGKPKLTRREKDVLLLIGQGLSSRQAADKLYVSKRTVDFHLQNIYWKLDVVNRVQALRIANQLGELDGHEVR